MEDAARLADRLLVMNHAKVLLLRHAARGHSPTRRRSSRPVWTSRMITKVMLELNRRGHCAWTPSVFTVAEAVGSRCARASGRRRRTDAEGHYTSASFSPATARYTGLTRGLSWCSSVALIVALFLAGGPVSYAADDCFPCPRSSAFPAVHSSLVVRGLRSRCSFIVDVHRGAQPVLHARRHGRISVAVVASCTSPGQGVLAAFCDGAAPDAAHHRRPPC